MPQPLLRANARRTPLAQSLPRLTSLVSPYTGIVPFTGQILSVTDDAPLFHVAAVTTKSKALIGFEANLYSGGISPTRDHALAASIGEAAERYAGACCPQDSLLVASAAELGARAVAPDTFALFSTAQYARPNFPFVRFDETTRLRWMSAREIRTGVERFVPAQLVYLVGVHDEPAISYGTSSGMACGATFEEAVLGGLLEIAERDAFLLTWYNRLSLPRVDWSGDPLLVREHERFYAPTRVPYTVLNLTDMLRVPTALVTLRNPRGNVALAVGAASSTSMQGAIRKALREAFQTRAFARRLRLDRPDFEPGTDFSAVRTFEDHVLTYAFDAYAAQTDFLEASSEVVPIAAIASVDDDDLTAAICEIARRLEVAGAHTYVSDLTPIDVQSAGLHVVRVVSPELCRLDVDNTCRFLGGRRLYDAAFAAGLIAAPLDADALNPLPHPFP